jgi:hypothetical protein
MSARTTTRAYPNLLDHPAAPDDTDPGHITRYGASVLGRALGHAIAYDLAAAPEDAGIWRDYGRLLWPAVASSPVMPPFARMADAASDVLDA